MNTTGIFRDMYNDKLSFINCANHEKVKKQCQVIMMVVWSL